MRISLKVPRLPKFNTLVLLLGLFLFALLLRLWGVWHGLPYIYSVDEPALVHSVLGLRFDLNPHHFDWPHFHFYLSFLVFGIFYKARVAWQVWNWKPAMEAAWPILWNDGAIFYLLLRLFSVFLGALTVVPVFLAAKELFNSRKLAFLAAVLFAIIPFHVENSKYALIDVPATFWAAWAFWLAIRVYKSPSLKNYLLAGVLGGLATSTKYNAVLVLLMLGLVHLVRTYKPHGGYKTRVVSLFTEWWKLALAGAASILTFFAGTPFALLDWKTFSNASSSTGAFWQIARGGNRFELPVFGRLFNTLFDTIPAGFGYPALVIAVIGLIAALRSPNKLYKAVGWFSIIYYLYVGSSVFAPIQIFMPLYIPLTLLFTLGVVTSVTIIKQELFETPKIWGRVVPLLMVAFIFPSLLSSLKIDYLYTAADTRNMAKEYIDYAIPKDKVIGLEGEYQPYYENHPIKGVPAWRWEPLSESRIEYVVISGESSVEAIKDNPKYGGLLDNLHPVYMMQNFGDQVGPNIFIYKLNYPLANRWWLDESKVPPLTINTILSPDHSWRDKVLPISYTTSLIVTGNWDLGGQVGQIMKTKDDYGYPTDKIGGHLNKFDLTLVNLPTPLVPDCKDFNVCASDNAIKSLVNAGADVVNLSSVTSFTETKDILTKNKIGYADNTTISFQTANDVKFAFVNFDSATDEKAIKETMAAAKNEKPQVVVASFDWLVSSVSEESARTAIDYGADLVIGNTTTVRKIELYKGKLIVYGLGPFINGTYKWSSSYSLNDVGIIGQFYFFNERLVDVEFEAVIPNSYSYLTGLDVRSAVINDWKTQQDLKDAIKELSQSQ